MIGALSMLSRTIENIAKNAMGVALLSLLCAFCGGDVRCQTPGPSDPNAKELHGGVEIGLRTVRAIALRASISPEDSIRVVSSDQLTPSTPLARDDKPTPEYIRDLAQTV